MSRRVVITGIGWVTPLGTDIEAVWKRLLAGESGVAPTSLFDASTFPTTFCAEVKSFDLKDFLGADAANHEGCNRNASFALAAAEVAWKQSGLAHVADLDPEQVGVYLGAGEGPIDFDNFAAAALAGWQSPGRALDAVAWAHTANDRLRRITELEQDPNIAAGHIAARFNAQGASLNTLTACAASTQALGEASRLIRRGDADVMISGGSHSMIHPLGVTGFNRLTALSNRNDSPQTASRPFDDTRDGFVLGEGAGILILEEAEYAKRRGATVLAEILGYGSTADAFRVTDMHEDGEGPIGAMSAALSDANVEPKDIDYISAHGTGTEENDKIESKAIASVFSAQRPDITVSSVKSMFGHLIAGAGAVELITCVLALRDQMLPPTINYVHPDPNCPLDYVPNEARSAKVQHVLSNSFGFGGQNDSLVIRHPDA